ncbi:glycosyltransferase [Sporomusa malonica]|uniref:Glycosyltransferase involved in cell wall bisynthesis n=1 Tax=Sporomusa malonica TaxID=112901 RepID=A0A1W2DKV4_9FIRM|nr:glycosyltransferase [Sporomusa malonica]SMC98033.1 Glycosyltransferase involved in cell wall bisynthesis [Sporomusa malonica]
MHKVKISVIMAVYNCEDKISEAIESILAQTYQDWSLIICDDCSTDDTHKIVLSYQQRYPNKIIALKNKINSKLAYSLNHCLQYAEGEYIARMDGDDISLPERLEKQLEFLLTHPEYDVVSTAMIPFDENGEREPRISKEIPNKYDLLKNPCFNHATILMKKSVYDALNGYVVLPRTTRGQDYDLWFRFFAAGYTGYNMTAALYKVREGIGDLKRRTFKTRLQAAETALYGYRLLNYPLRYYIFAFKPIIAGIIPQRLMYMYHNMKFSVNSNKAE